MMMADLHTYKMRNDDADDDDDDDGGAFNLLTAHSYDSNIAPPCGGLLKFEFVCSYTVLWLY